MSTVTVSPGAEATTTLTVRNDGDIVEAYTFEVVGDCAAWSTVEPARVSLYPGTSEVVTVRLAPPRSHEVRAGEIPLGVRVLPTEHPESVAVPEATVVVGPFHELRAELDPRRRSGWLGARFRTSVQNKGNTAVDIALTGKQAGEELRLAFTPGQRRLEPGESAEMGLRVRTRKLIWFGTPVTWPFEVEAAEGTEGDTDGEQPGRAEALPGEFAQLPVLPRWLLIVLAALLALLLAWFALVRPAVRSTAKQAAHEAAQEKTPPAGNRVRQQGAVRETRPVVRETTRGRASRTGPEAPVRAVPVRQRAGERAAPSRARRRSMCRPDPGPRRTGRTGFRRGRYSESRTSWWRTSRETKEY